MDILELGAIGELVGGVAVIGSLLYVGIQIRQNTRVVQSTAHHQMLDYTSSPHRQPRGRRFGPAWT